MTALTLPLPGGVTIAVAVGWIPAPVFGPVVTVARRPRPLCAGLVVAIVGVAGALGLLPASAAFPLAGGRTAKTLLGALCPRPERMAAARTAPALHRGNLRAANCAQPIPAEPADYYNLNANAPTIRLDCTSERPSSPGDFSAPPLTQTICRKVDPFP